MLACVKSLKKQTKAAKEVFVVLDPHEELIKHYKDRLDPEVKLIVSSACGLSCARNAGIEASTSELIAFIDDDAIADPLWLENVAKNFDDPSVIGVGGRIIPMWPKGTPTWFPEELYWIVGCSYKGLPTKREPIRNPIGCNMIFRRDIFDSLGSFSTSVGRVGNKLLGHDDTEFGIRANSIKGTKIMYDPCAVVYHQVSSNRVSPKYVFKRSYAEGFSKAFVSKYPKQDNSMMDTEKTYLRELLLGTPQLFKGDLRVGFSKVAILWFSTGLVFLGYIAGLSSK